MTDDNLSLNNAHDTWTILNAIIGKEIIVHIRVNHGLVASVKKYFDDALQENLNPIWLLIGWIYRDDGYLIQIRKRLTDSFNLVLRLYPDGTGVIVAFGWNGEYKTFYFQLCEPILNDIRVKVEAKVDYIITHTEYTHEDDREYGFSASVKYGLLWKYPDAEQQLESGGVYEDKDYADDVFEIKIAKLILSIPMIKEKWMNMKND